MVSSYPGTTGSFSIGPTATFHVDLNDFISTVSEIEAAIYIPLIYNDPSYFFNDPGIYEPIIIPGAAIFPNSMKYKIKAKYIRAGPSALFLCTKKDCYF